MYVYAYMCKYMYVCMCVCIRVCVYMCVGGGGGGCKNAYVVQVIKGMSVCMFIYEQIRE